MVKRAILVVVVFVLVVLMAAPASSSEPSPLAGHVIAIDPGHGGQDLGSTACKELLVDEDNWVPEDADAFLEKHVNLDIASRLQARLQEDGAGVYMTRTEDLDLSSHERGDGINASAAEVLVNLHLNGWTDPHMDGLYVFYGKARKDKAFVQVMHNTMLANAALTDTPDTFIDFGIKQFAAGVLLWADIPSALLESAFISNAWECRELSGGGGERQDQIAQAIYEGLHAWFSDLQPPPNGKNRAD
jgi:N-acetylmuramoyl-L-alanine amidase